MLDDLEKFVPQKLTRRIVFSKNHSIFDSLGKLAPVMSILKADLRGVVKVTEGWDDPIPLESRSKWIQNFWMLEKLRGQKYQRATMPEDAVDSKMDIIIAVDAAEIIKMLGAVGIVAKFSDVVKQDLVLLVQPGIEHLKGLIPVELC